MDLFIYGILKMNLLTVFAGFFGLMGYYFLPVPLSVFPLKTLGVI